MKMNVLYEEIFKRFGSVTRARNCFLYTKKGIRLTDMFQENGRAILGWDAGNAFTFLKNTLNRAQVGGFICEDKGRHYRLEKAVSLLLSSVDGDEKSLLARKVFVFSSKSDAVSAALAFSESTGMWRPWISEKVDWTSTDCVVIQPPLPWTDSIYLLAVREDKVAVSDKAAVSDKSAAKVIAAKNTIGLPFAVEAAITRSIYNLIAELKVREEKNWFLYDPVLTKYWTRKGPYLYPKISQEEYDAFVLHCLDCEIIINPDFNQPSIVPFGADRGVFTKLKNNPFIPKI